MDDMESFVFSPRLRHLDGTSETQQKRFGEGVPSVELRADVCSSSSVISPDGLEQMESSKDLSQISVG